MTPVDPTKTGQPKMFPNACVEASSSNQRVLSMTEESEDHILHDLRIHGVFGNLRLDIDGKIPHAVISAPTRADSVAASELVERFQQIARCNSSTS